MTNYFFLLHIYVFYLIIFVLPPFFIYFFILLCIPLYLIFFLFIFKNISIHNCICSSWVFHIFFAFPNVFVNLPLFYGFLFIFMILFIHRCITVYTVMYICTDVFIALL